MDSRAKLSADLIVWILLLTMPYWLAVIGGYTALGSQVLILALAATALNFLLGFTGMLSFGHGAFFGLGSYGVGLTIKYLLPNTLVGLGIGVATGTIAAALIGALIARLRGIYFAMVTIAFGQIFYFIAIRWNNVTGGDDGLSGWRTLPINLGFTRIDILHNQIAFYYFALLCFAVSIAIMAALLRSPFGRTLLAIRENEERARFLGIPVDFHIWLSWLVSCIFASLAGALYALLNNFSDPHFLHWEQSGEFVIMAVLGGMRTFWGPLLGAVIFLVLQNYVSSETENWMTFIGVFFIMVVLLFPRGVLGLLRWKSA
ncbi:MAG TPA: branched-chain amino acid ABC transporter permease [Xanthobacteraceae bacterium]|nr:branched-chain amino acid ABC transporter permease [Xanthobacteraceae bacterium]